MKRLVFAAASVIISLTGISFADPTSINIVSASLRVSGYGFAYYQNDLDFNYYDIMDDQPLSTEISGSIPGYGYDASSSAWFGSAGDIPSSSPWAPDIGWAPEWADSLSIGAFTENYTDDTGGDSQAYASSRAAYTFTPLTDSLDLVISLKTTGGDSEVWFSDLTDDIQLLSYQYDAPIDPFSMYSYSNTYSYALDPSHLYTLEMATQNRAFYDTYSQTQFHTALTSSSPAIIPEPASILLTTIGLYLLANIKRKKIV